MTTATVTHLGSDSRQHAVGDAQIGRVGRLVRAAASGDQAAWEELYAEFEMLVRGVARAHRLPEADVADVAQTTWLHLVEHLGRIHDPEKLGAWLATTAGRESTRVLSRSRRQIPTDQLPDSSVEDDVAERLAAGEREAALRQAFRCLRRRDQALLGLLVAEWAPSYEQIGRILEIPVGSIGPTRARSLTRLRREAALVGLTAERAGAAA